MVGTWNISYSQSLIGGKGEGSVCEQKDLHIGLTRNQNPEHSEWESSTLPWDYHKCE